MKNMDPWIHGIAAAAAAGAAAGTAASAAVCVYYVLGGNCRLTMLVAPAKERTRSESGCKRTLQSEQVHVGACKIEPGAVRATQNRARARTFERKNAA